MERVVRTFETHQAADEADEARYREMSGNEKLRILLELIAARNPDEAVIQRSARVYPLAQSGES